MKSESVARKHSNGSLMWKVVRDGGYIVVTVGDYAFGWADAEKLAEALLYHVKEIRGS